MKQKIHAKAALLTLIFILGIGSVPGRAQQSHPRLSDAMIRTLVEHRLMDQMVLRNDNIQVLVRDGAVTLEGTVRNVAEKKRAERVALGIDDVSSVRNELFIETTDRSDQQIADDLASEIRGFVFYDVFDWIEGDVRNGLVTLQGWVREPWRKNDYQSLAERIVGVRGVDNLIEVLPASAYDDQLRISAARSIYGDPRFARYASRTLPPLHIIVDNGRVTLEGVVGSQLERRLAESIVRLGVMAQDVENHLRVDEEMLRAVQGPPPLPGQRLFSNANDPRRYNISNRSGKFEFRGRIDGEVVFHIRGDVVAVEAIQGGPVRVERFQFSQPIPSQPLTSFQLRKRDGRGLVELLEQPSPDNGFTAVIRILDERRGDDRYHFELNWRR